MGLTKVTGNEGLAAAWHFFFTVLYAGAMLFHGLSVWTHLERRKRRSLDGCRCVDEHHD